MDQMVKNVMAAYRQSIQNLDWMSPEHQAEGPGEAGHASTRRSAIRRSGAITRRWRSAATTWSATCERATAFEWNRDLAKLGKPVDRDEWHMTPQTVNAYYNPSMNEIVFPAAILQPPFFNLRRRRRRELRRHRRGDRP